MSANRYYAIIEDERLIMIGIGYGGMEITESEYNQIMDIIQTRPTPPDGKGYHLKTDLTWEEYDLPSEPDPPEEEQTDAEKLADAEAALALLGVEMEATT